MINAIKLKNSLEEQGLSKELAETWVKEWVEFMNENLALKSDLEKVSTKMDYEFSLLRTEMKALSDSTIIKMGGVFVAWTSLLAFLQKL